MAAQRSSDKQAIGVVKKKHEEMKRVNLDVMSRKRLEELDDEVKMSWLIAKKLQGDGLSQGEGCHENSFSITNGRAGLQVCMQHG